MGTKSEQLQIRLTPEQKTILSHTARRAGMGMSAYVLAKLLPPARLRFRELLAALVEGARRSFVLAELNDLLAGLTADEFKESVAGASLDNLSPYTRNYVAAMVEQAAHQKGVAPPDWTVEVEPLEEPRFVESLPGLRLHLLASAPVPFRRRNIFADSSVGDRV